MTNMERLKELTEKLTPYPQLLIAETSFKAHVKSATGKIVVYGLYHSLGFASVSLCIADAGASMVSHTHTEREFIYIIKGRLIWNVGGEIFDMKTGDVRFVEPQTMHGATWPERTEMLCWTIPDNKLWPKGIEVNNVR